MEVPHFENEILVPDIGLNFTRFQLISLQRHRLIDYMNVRVYLVRLNIKQYYSRSTEDTQDSIQDRQHYYHHIVITFKIALLSSHCHHIQDSIIIITLSSHSRQHYYHHIVITFKIALLSSHCHHIQDSIIIITLSSHSRQHYYHHIVITFLELAAITSYSLEKVIILCYFVSICCVFLHPTFIKRFFWRRIDIYIYS